MELQGHEFYRFMAPRLTLLVSTCDKEGNPNAAPFSFVMPVSINPPLAAISTAHKRHTLANIRETGQFVLNLPIESIIEKLHVCSDPFDKGVNEIKEAGLTEMKSVVVKPPRVEECAAWFECELEWEKEAGDHVIVIGKIVKAEVKDEFMKDGAFDLAGAKPLLHVTGTNFALAERIVHVHR